jgi:preprotein translocase subunit SecG
MIQLLLILALIVCVILVLIVLIQNPKGGGLSSNFSSSSQLMGVQKTGDFLEKGTWGFAIVLMVLAMAINVAVKGGSAASTGAGGTDRSKTLKTPAAQPNTFPGPNGQSSQHGGGTGAGQLPAGGAKPTGK